ncbi:sensor histidine kinase N-terminal domain-containing protein [Polaromonas sp. CT11-55]|uniref:sensor histidine kinase n=1 Tax=Polaromonas sp. CT11-55 TaxID=3243045 RepID=UPI0039A56B3E
MRWKRREGRSLRAALLLLLLPMLGAITALELWMTDRDATDAANSAYDRSLLGAVKSIAANVSTESGGLSVELPYRMFEFFELTANGQVYFRIASSDGLVELGSADLPPAPGTLGLETPVFYDAHYFGEAVRVAAYRMPTGKPGMAGNDDHATVLIQVAENVQSRQEFTWRFMALAIWRDGVVFLLTLLCVALGVSLALRPLARLAAEVGARRPDDLAPVRGTDLPAEVRPLVAAVNQQMARTQQLATQQRAFIDDASHQLRTHLTILQMQVDYVIGEADAARKAEAIAALRDEIGRSTHTTNQLLTLARSDSAVLNAQPIHLAAIARDVALRCMPAARAKGIDLGVSGRETDDMAEGDAEFLKEALLNLAANAVAHVPAGGVVTVTFSSDMLGWSLGVTDNGAGLSEALRNTLGQRFSRQRDQAARASGSGLGLAIARAVAERHGGALRLDIPESGTGLHASLWWPRSGRDGPMTAGA